MQRKIVAFARDANGEWTARLDCGHRQHTRHNPPLIERAWVTTEAGRRAKLGAVIDCPLCARREMPEGSVAYKRTAEFDARSTPRALRSRHKTKSGVWAKIHVLAGSLLYVVGEPLPSEERLCAPAEGIVVPEVEHSVEPDDEARFFVEFYRAPLA